MPASDFCAPDMPGASASPLACEPAGSQVWLARASLYELLSLAFLPATPPVAEALVAGEFAAACAELADACGLVEVSGETVAGFLGYVDKDADEVLHEVRREYTRLFVGTRDPLVTPYADVHGMNERGMRGLLFVGPESMTIERAMRACGVGHAADAANEPLDHMGSMCEFLSMLCLACAGAAALPAGSPEPGTAYRSFYNEHFAPFARWFATEVREQGATPFYHAAGVLLAACV